MLTATMPFCAAKHIACCSSDPPASACVPSPEKLSPATNTSTGRGGPLIGSAAATSSTLRSLSPYLILRVNATCSHVLALSAASEDVLSASTTSPARNGPLPSSGFRRGLGTRADAAAIMTARTHIVTIFFIGEPYRSCRPDHRPRVGRFGGSHD